jgi:hypothetical protein
MALLWRCSAPCFRTGLETGVCGVVDRVMDLGQMRTWAFVLGFGNILAGGVWSFAPVHTGRSSGYGWMWMALMGLRGGH